MSYIHSEVFPGGEIKRGPIAFYLAYYTSLLKGYNVDRPRNLAKSVTVE